MSLEVGWERVRLRAPELAPGTWLNHPPLTLKGLRGRVVLVDFWDYTCVNCLRTLPYLAEWWRRYRDQGLTIIGVHAPEFSFARRADFVRQAMQDYGIDYPVVLDNEHRTWYAFANRFWPAKYLIDQDGYLRYKRFGEGHYDETEAAIQALLREPQPDLALPDVMPALRPEDTPGAVCYRPTPELYAGAERGDLANAEGYRPGQVVVYADPGQYEERHLYAVGAWGSDDEALWAAAPDATLVLPYRAAQVNVVLAPDPSPDPSPGRGGEWKSPLSLLGKGAGGLGPPRLTLTQDGAALTAEQAGEDVHLAGGQAWVEVDRPKMYNLVVNPTVERHILRLRAASPAVAVYAFTFVTCVRATEDEGRTTEDEGLKIKD